jgi:hypothetical protein
MMLMPAMSYENVMNFNWPELKSWHETAVQTFKAMRGIN